MKQGERKEAFERFKQLKAKQDLIVKCMARVKGDDKRRRSINQGTHQ